MKSGNFSYINYEKDKGKSPFCAASLVITEYSLFKISNMKTFFGVVIFFGIFAFSWAKWGDKADHPCTPPPTYEAWWDHPGAYSKF